MLLTHSRRVVAEVDLAGAAGRAAHAPEGVAALALAAPVAAHAPAAAATAHDAGAGESASQAPLLRSLVLEAPRVTTKKECIVTTMEIFSVDCCGTFCSVGTAAGSWAAGRCWASPAAASRAPSGATGGTPTKPDEKNLTRYKISIVDSKKNENHISFKKFLSLKILKLRIFCLFEKNAYLCVGDALNSADKDEWHLPLLPGLTRLRLVVALDLHSHLNHTNLASVKTILAQVLHRSLQQLAQTTLRTLGNNHTFSLLVFVSKV